MGTRRPDKSGNYECVGTRRPDKSGNYKYCHPHLDPLPSREREGGGKGGDYGRRGTASYGETG